ncbi:endospore germination permease [Heliobacterium undosum]|uniref:Endospore germination permease n=1 Tax=Heliomicrobium undosum TaxID=121734 RepID=A0A845LA94_9FIRM|nr:endospore germination permease [Heliomicrobium undosum]MZP29831.1 endospore germination permease [Heliomicrobium undosum]
MRRGLRDGHVGLWETTGLLIFVLFIKMHLAYPRELAVQAQNAAWMIPIIAVPGALLGFYALERLLASFPGDSLISIANLLGGPLLRWLTGVVFCVILLVLTGYEVRIFSEFIITTLLPNTPVHAIVVSLLLLMMTLALAGFEHITRVAWSAFPAIMALFIVSMIAVVPLGQFVHLAPWFGRQQAAPLWEIGLWRTSLYAEIVLLGLVAPLFRKHSDLRRAGFTALLVTAFLFTAVELIYIMVFPPPMGERLGFPLYQLVRLIHYGPLLQRLEPVFVFIWAVMTINGLAALFYGSAIALAQGSQARDFRPLLFPLFVLLFFIVFYPDRSITAVIDFAFLPDYFMMVLFGIPLALWIWAKWVKNGEEAKP